MSFCRIIRKLRKPLEKATKKGVTALKFSPRIALDARSKKNIGTCTPKAQKAFIVWLTACRKNGLNVVVISGTRTYEEQNELYALGRTKTGKIVTNARGGYSNHNFGVAIDFVIFEGVNSRGGTGNAMWSCVEMTDAGRTATEMGLEWGGDWKFHDSPHIQLRTGLTLAQMRRKHEKGEIIA